VHFIGLYITTKKVTWLLILFLVHRAKSNPEADIIAEGEGENCMVHLSIHINVIECDTAE